MPAATRDSVSRVIFNWPRSVRFQAELESAQNVAMMVGNAARQFTKRHHDRGIDSVGELEPPLQVRIWRRHFVRIIAVARVSQSRFNEATPVEAALLPLLQTS